MTAATNPDSSERGEPGFTGLTGISVREAVA